MTGGAVLGRRAEGFNGQDGVEELVNSTVKSCTAILVMILIIIYIVTSTGFGCSKIVHAFTDITYQLPAWPLSLRAALHSCLTAKIISLQLQWSLIGASLIRHVYRRGCPLDAGGDVHEKLGGAKNGVHDLRPFLFVRHRCHVVESGRRVTDLG